MAKKTVKESVASVSEVIRDTKETVTEASKGIKEDAKKFVDETRAAAKAAVTDTQKEVKKTARTVKETVIKEYAKHAMKDCYVQYLGNEYSQNEILSKVEDAFTKEGHKLSSIKELKLYIKPEEAAAYYVINETYTGKVDL